MPSSSITSVDGSRTTLSVPSPVSQLSAHTRRDVGWLESWYDALNDAETRFRQLLTSPSNDWKRVSSSSANSSGSIKGKGKARASTSLPEITDVVVHRNSSQSKEDIYRLVLEVPAGEGFLSLEPWRAVLSTPELRQEWDPAVVDAHLVEAFDYDTRIIKTNFTLGWPANPRDTVTIARTIHDDTTVIDIATSLPRSPDEPVYLRPSPPYVRSHVTLFAWCIQHIKSQPSNATNADSQQPKRRLSMSGRLRITCYWQHDLRAIWNITSPGTMAQQLSSMVLGLLKTTLKRATRIPKLLGYGFGVNIEKIRFQIDREALTIEYAIIPLEDEEHHQPDPSKAQGLEELHVLRERRRLTRAVECILPAAEGWDVRVSTKASSEEVEKLPWSALAVRSSSSALPSSPTSRLPLDQILLRLTHASLIDDHSVLKVTVVIEISGPSGGLRLNGVPQTVKDFDHDRFSTSGVGSQQIFQDLASAMGVSLTGSSSVGSPSVISSSASSTQSDLPISKERNPAAEKSILARVKRNYIYFSSLLQEPEAKWKRTTESRGVTVTQLDSIDPTLVVYGAEATFVGVNIWDLYAAVVSHGAKEYWDKQHEDAILLDDVNELTELWHLKTKAAWPVNGRDSVVLKTVYKSPTTIHVFSFSADDLAHLFPPGLIPPPASSTTSNNTANNSTSSVNANIIRTQIDLQGWAIEALSPTTTRLTLLEQSDPKGWTNKTSIPAQMINSLAGIGDFAIKWGGVPIVTRLAGAKKTSVKYEHERRSWRLEYEPAARSMDKEGDATPTSPVIECEIRCDMDTWSPTSLDIVVDPPPQAISCLRRHRLSSEGGGVWLTITHQDAVCIEDERLMVIIRRGPTIGTGGGSSAGGFVMVNGERIEIDYEGMDEEEIRSAKTQKRVKPTRIPLDQPPVSGVIRKRREDTESEGQTPSSPPSSATTKTAPKTSSPLSRFFTYAVDQTQQTIAAIAPVEGEDVPTDDSPEEIPSPSKKPMQHALDALAWTQDFHANPLLAGWLSVNEKSGINVKRRIINEVSNVVPVFKGEKVIEGVSAEDLAAVIGELTFDESSGYYARKKWDDRYEEERVLERYGAGGRASFKVGKTGFPFKDRGFYVATIVAKEQGAAPGMSRQNTANPAALTSGGTDSGTKTPSSTTSTNSAVYVISTSYNPSALSVPFSESSYNPYLLPIGRVHLDAWILETLDPYNTKENYAVPSARCTRLTCIDYDGPVVNSMVANYNGGYMARALIGLDTSMRESRGPVMRIPTHGLILKGRGGDDDDVEDEDMFRKRGKKTWRIGAAAGKAGWRAVRSKRVDKGKERRVVVESKFHSGSRSFESLVLVQYSFERKKHTMTRSEDEGVGPEADTSNDTQPSLASLLNNEKKLAASSISSAPATLSASTSRTLSPPPDQDRRERTLSNISSTSSITAMPGSPPTGFRGRSNSRFLRNNAAASEDFLVGEWVIDMKLYPEGYEVLVRTRVHRESSRAIDDLIGLESVFAGEKEKVAFPFVYGIHQLPHSLGIDSAKSVEVEEDQPTKHLLRVTLPTGEFLKNHRQPQQEPITDPLTGEIREPKEVETPKWLEVLALEAGVIVGVSIRPSSSGKKGSKRRKQVVVFDDTCDEGGKELDVVDEKDGHAREETYGVDGVIERVKSEPETVPIGFEKPLAISETLVDRAALDANTSSEVTSGAGPNVTGSAGDETPGSPNPQEGAAGESKGESGILSRSPSTNALAATAQSLVQTANGGKSGFLGIGRGLGSFLQMSSRSPSRSGSTSNKDAEKPDTGLAHDAVASHEMHATQNLIMTAQRTVKQDWWMFMIVGLIAFLLGSFMRSLLEPTDFVYVATSSSLSLTSAGTHFAGGSEWREVKRVVELPAGGRWDLWIGFVRRRV
ncbi:hypothetical protein V5O48_000480 [Marasmius crinis-equi]|uniref:START domain-containing protein n=1 Tax=Marasmius crinis-equi TaxID=585013 RepID=A0ABR3G140_9AGAR